MNAQKVYMLVCVCKHCMNVCVRASKHVCVHATRMHRVYGCMHVDVGACRCEDVHTDYAHVCTCMRECTGTGEAAR